MTATVLLISGCSSTYNVEPSSSQSREDQTRPKFAGETSGTWSVLTEAVTEFTVDEDELEKDGERTTDFISGLKSVFDSKEGTVYTCVTYEDGSREMDQMLFKDGASLWIYYEDMGKQLWKVDSRLSILQLADGTCYLISFIESLAVEWYLENDNTQYTKDIYYNIFDMPQEYSSTEICELDGRSYIKEHFTVSKDNGREYTLDYMFASDDDIVRIMLYNEAGKVQNDIICRYSTEADEALLKLPDDVSIITYEELMSY